MIETDCLGSCRCQISVIGMLIQLAEKCWNVLQLFCFFVEKVELILIHIGHKILIQNLREFKALFFCFVAIIGLHLAE